MITPEDRKRLEVELRSQALNHRITALNELAKAPSDQAIPILQDLANEKEFLFRRIAVMGLGNHSQSDEAFQVLQSIVEQEKDNNVLSEAVNSLFEFGQPAIPLLQNIFEKNDNWLLRQTILSLLMESDDLDALLTTAALGLNDKTQTVKETAILSLRTAVLSASYQERALALLTQTAQSTLWRDRWRTATALTSCQAPKAQELLSTLRQDEHHRVVAAALDAQMQ